MNLLFLTCLFPLLGWLLLAFSRGRLSENLAALIGVGSVGLSALTAAWVIWQFNVAPPPGGVYTQLLWQWMNVAGFAPSFTLYLDGLSLTMLGVVTGVGFLIHLFASWYMRGEEGYSRFFAYTNLFIASMLFLVLGDNLLFLYFGWEGVGLCSYLLIGFYFKHVPNGNAALKAFIVTRIGDVFMAIGLFILLLNLGTLNIQELLVLAPQKYVAGDTWLWLATLMLLGGAVGKSAQLPLQTWLADAMAGPTPVSALIHAATMVTAGVYLLCRLFPLVSLSPIGMGAIAAVGALTALYAATCALSQREIKRVLAYSTMSQIGFMFLAVGAGSVAGAMFHLFTHAFFKAALFMGAGCVIHLAGEENDIFKIGGMARYSRPVFWTFFLAALCLAGAPLTGGFFSKETILLAAATGGHPLYWLLLGVALLTALLTALYTFRLLYLVFSGARRGHAGHHHLPSSMVWTLFPLAALGLFGGLLNLPGWEALTRYLGPLAGRDLHATHALEWALAGASVLAVLAGWLIARSRYRTFPGEPTGILPEFMLKGWQADRLVEKAILAPFAALARFFWQGTDHTGIDGILDGAGKTCMAAGELVRRMTTGRLSTYLGAFAWGLLALLGWMLLTVVR